MKLLFTVKDVFEIEGRGLLLAPGIAKDDIDDSIHSGTLVSLHRPDRAIIETTINDLPMIRYLPELPLNERMVPIALPRDILPGDVPVGTRVYLIPNQ